MCATVGMEHSSEINVLISAWTSDCDGFSTNYMTWSFMVAPALGREEGLAKSWKEQAEGKSQPESSGSILSAVWVNSSPGTTSAQVSGRVVSPRSTVWFIS